MDICWYSARTPAWGYLILAPSLLADGAEYYLTRASARNKMKLTPDQKIALLAKLELISDDQALIENAIRSNETPRLGTLAKWLTRS